MLYAVVMICASTGPACTRENSFYTIESDPVFATEEACQAAAKEHMTTIPLQPGPYRYKIDCLMPGVDL